MLYQNSATIIEEYIRFLNWWMDRKGMETIRPPWSSDTRRIPTRPLRTPSPAGAPWHRLAPVSYTHLYMTFDGRENHCLTTPPPIRPRTSLAIARTRTGASPAPVNRRVVRRKYCASRRRRALAGVVAPATVTVEMTAADVYKRQDLRGKGPRLSNTSNS